jgi:hypothetical protein
MPGWLSCTNSGDDPDLQKRRWQHPSLPYHRPTCTTCTSG